MKDEFGAKTRYGKKPPTKPLASKPRKRGPRPAPRTLPTKRRKT